MEIEIEKPFTKFDLTNKTALVTGAAGLLGIEHTKALIESGARVIMTDISQEALALAAKNVKSEMGICPDNFTMDVSNETSVLALNDKLIKEETFVDILINNAAIDPKVDKDILIESSRLENFSLDNWDYELEVGLKGAMICSKVFGHEMAKRYNGVILNISSDLSIFSPDQRLYMKEGIDEEFQPVKPVTYSVIKHGLIGLTKYLATYWASKNVRCNALSPGGVFVNQEKDFVKKLIKLIPQNRMANREEYHGAIQFLCSDASAYMNGQNIVMDGGRSIW